MNLRELIEKALEAGNDLFEFTRSPILNRVSITLAEKEAFEDMNLENLKKWIEVIKETSFNKNIAELMSLFLVNQVFKVLILLDLWRIEGNQDRWRKDEIEELEKIMSEINLIYISRAVILKGQFGDTLEIIKNTKPHSPLNNQLKHSLIAGLLDIDQSKAEEIFT